MHPMLLITSPADGLVYLNGVFAGEVRKDAPLFRPISPSGALYLEYRPFPSLHLPSADRIVFANGSPMPVSFQHTENLHAVAWPFGITEIEITPKRIYTGKPNVKTLSGAGHLFKFASGNADCYLETGLHGKMYTHKLPENAKEPYLAEGDGVLFVSGETDDNMRYALVLSPDGKDALLSLVASEISFLPGNRISKTESAGDTAGHIIKTVYEKNEDGYREISREILKNPESEFRAVTPSDAALCTLECMLLGLDAEAKEYLSPAFSADDALPSLVASAASASLLRFTPPDGRTAAALLISENNHMARAVPVYFRAEMLGGEWKISEMKI